MIKEQVKAYWEANVCETDTTKSPKYTKDYFEETEQYRYSVTPDVFQFAQFTRWHGKKVLEIGIGAGTDFIQWVRAGAEAYGIDLTEEAVEHTKKRLELYGLKAREVRVGDAENLPYANNTFDLVYSWGVLHHTPDTEKAIGEAIRVAKPGGRIKLMLYHRWSVLMLFKWLQVNFLKGKFPKSISWCLYHECESVGTKAFTFSELRQLLSQYPVQILEMKAQVNNYDLLWRYPLLFRALAYILVCLMGFNRAGFFMTIDLGKV